MLQLYYDYATLSDFKKIVLILQKRKSNKLKTTQIFKLQCNICRGGGVVFFAGTRPSQNFERKLWENWSEPCKLNILCFCQLQKFQIPPPTSYK